MRVLLLCGGRSDEHQVSLESAKSVLGALAADVAAPGSGRMTITPLVITRDGGAVSSLESRELLGLAPAVGQTWPPAEPASGALATSRSLSDAVASAVTEGGFDVVFPLLHGPYGEDGSVQGLLKVMGLPFVGTDVLGSAIGMDKLTMKAVFAAAGLPQVRHAAVTRHAFTENRDDVLADLGRLDLPLFVKPANLGSSIGITRVDTADDLAGAIDHALGFDRRVIVEEAAMGARELEVAVLGNDRPHASPVGEIRYQAGFYDYEAKYTDGHAELIIPADVPAPVAEAARALALRAFAVIDAAGLARVDMFYLPDGRLLLNEINTMPGFTRHSMYPKLWEAAGVPYPELVTRLVGLALERR
ncbi:MAG TPA: D-alanine--D-alanine ligase family protein [Trueperaceae bacterium]|nr:D-alanine--D-alanine ligase family protein [Trueperaceae bacterium]